MIVNKDHIKNLVENDTENRFQKLENPEQIDIYYDNYTGKYFLYDKYHFQDNEEPRWFYIEFVASIQKKIWENWDELATERDEVELKYLDVNPDFSCQLVSYNGVVYYVWFQVDWYSGDKKLYLPTEKPKDDK